MIPEVLFLVLAISCYRWARLGLVIEILVAEPSKQQKKMTDCRLQLRKPLVPVERPGDRIEIGLLLASCAAARSGL